MILDGKENQAVAVIRRFVTLLYSYLRCDTVDSNILEESIKVVYKGKLPFCYIECNVDFLNETERPNEFISIMRFLITYLQLQYWKISDWEYC